MIIIPSAGASRRFINAGVETPKFMLPLGDMTLFERVLDGFRPYHSSEQFLVITRNIPSEIKFFENKMRALGISDFEIIGLAEAGQGMLADICAGLKQTRFSLDQPVFIHPVDIIRKDFEMPRSIGKSFSMDFETPAKGVGSYHVSNAADFLRIYQESRAPGVRQHVGERAMEIAEFLRFSVALKMNGYSFKRSWVDPSEITHCGVPAQYMNTLAHFMADAPHFPFRSGDPLLFTNRADGIKIRNQMINIWLDSIRQKYGPDDKTKDYQDAITAYAEQVVSVTDGHHMGPSLKAYILNELSEAVESQILLAEKLEEKSYTYRQDDKNISHFKVQKNPTLFAFLSRSYSEESAEAFLKTQQYFSKDSGTAKKFYARFWGLTSEERVKFISDVLGVGQANDLLFKLSLQQNTQGVLDDFLPPEKKGSRAREYGSKFATQLAISATQEELGFLFTHMLEAVHKDKTQPLSSDPDIQFGYRMAFYLMGIGGAKIAQGAHSFSQTPEEWLEGLSQTKSQVLPMRRAYFLRKAMQLSGGVSLGIDRIGPRLGTGTYVDTKAVFFSPEYLTSNPSMAEAQSGSGLVLQLVKENSGALSQNIFDLAVRTLKNIIAKDKEAEKSIGGFIPVIEHKAQMIHEETDLRIIAQKAKVAENLLSGVSVEIGSLTAAFAGAGVFKSDQGFKVSRNIPGKHFNQLPENTREERALKSAIAEAIFTTELFMITSGNPFNHDPHGDNQGIEISVSSNGTVTAHIGNFDDGAITLQPPTKKQQKLFANIIMDAVANSAINGFNPVSSLKHTFSKAQKAVDLSGEENAHDLSYVDAMVEAVVSLGDYTKYMNKSAFVRSLRAVCNVGHIAQDIGQTFADRFTAVQEMQRGKPNAAEEYRMRTFYPPPTEETQRFASPLNRIFGKCIMIGGGTLLQSSWVSYICGTNRIILPAGYSKLGPDMASV